MSTRATHQRLNRRLLVCTRCERLRSHCAEVARRKRAAFRDQAYHGKPVPNFGDPSAALLIVGLAPAAHGANRTGRMFTGDRSGDFLCRAMHEAGFANQGRATHRNDGLVLTDVLITAVVHCAPPQNKPTSRELANCRPFLDDVFGMLPRLKVVLCLGRIAFDAVMKRWQEEGLIERRSTFRFAHGAEHAVTAALTILCSYHPSQQNTFTGRLTNRMMLDVFERARRLLDGRPG